MTLATLRGEGGAHAAPGVIIDRSTNSQPLRIRPALRASRGSTLIELMIGLTIIAVLAAIALPGISSLVRRQNLRNAADDVVFAAEKARSRARASRKAHGLWVGKGAGTPEGLSLVIYRGTTARCADVLTGQKVLEIDHGPKNALGNPWVQIVGKAPAEAGTPGLFLCFTPDGRVVRSDTSMPFSPPKAGGIAAGNVYFALQRVDSGYDTIGDVLQVQVTYNGTARITTGLPLSQLQGGG